MQSTEEYLDQLLASVNEQDAQHEADSNKNHKKMKPIEELDESELTEEVLQKQLALLLGLEVASDDEDDDSDDFMTQYATQVIETVDEKEDFMPGVVQEGIMDIPDFAEDTAVSPTTEVTNTGVLSPDEIAELFSSMENNAETEAKTAEPEVVSEPEVKVAEPAPEVSNTGVLSPDEIAELFASMENNTETEVKAAEPEAISEPEVKVSEPAPEVSNTGVLSPDEIAELFASMENNTEPEEVKEEIKPEEPEIPSVQENSAPQVSDSGVLSPDEIAALFASMGNDDAATASVTEENTTEANNVEAWKEMPQSDVSAGSASDIGLTREELEEIGLGDIADVLVDSSKEIPEDFMSDLQEDAESFLLDGLMEDVSEEADIVQSANEERQIIDIPDFDEEMLLDIDNVEAMLEATAKLAEEKESAMPDAQVEEDIMSMLNQFEEESMQESLANREADEKAAQEAVNNVLNEEAEASESSAEEEGKTKKKKKAKKEKVKKEKPVKEKKNKVSLKDRIVAFMFEDENLEDESLDGDGTKAEIPDDVDSLEQLEALEAKPAKAKKEKASKKKKKEAKGGKASDENAAIEAELEEEDKKAKKKKEKPVKEKKAKKVVVSEKTPAEIAAEKREARHSIGTKGIVATLLVCASLLGLILVGTYFLPRQLSLMTARAAFYNGNYEEAAMRFMGQDLSESDKILYEKADLLFGLEERYHQYDIYVKRGMTKDALDTLLQGVIACDKEENLADRLGIMTEWKMMRDMFIDALQNQFGLDEETVEQICGLRNPDYTVAVENILNGKTFDDMSNYGGEASVETSEEEVEAPEEEGGLNADELEDLLPEEEAIIEQLQQENEVPSETQDLPSGNDNELYSGSVEDGSVNFAN